MTNSDTAIREFQRKYAMKTYRLNPETLQREQTGYDVNFMIDLTAIISEHYYPKEFVRWMFQGCPFLIGENGAGNIIAFSVRDGKQFTFDELFNYWKENVRC